jgi:hypothetical protein
MKKEPPPAEVRARSVAAGFAAAGFPVSFGQERSVGCVAKHRRIDGASPECIQNAFTYKIEFLQEIQLFLKPKTVFSGNT